MTPSTSTFEATTVVPQEPRFQCTVNPALDSDLLAEYARVIYLITEPEALILVPRLQTICEGRDQFYASLKTVLGSARPEPSLSILDSIKSGYMAHTFLWAYLNAHGVPSPLSPDEWQRLTRILASCNEPTATDPIVRPFLSDDSVRVENHEASGVIIWHPPLGLSDEDGVFSRSTLHSVPHREPASFFNRWEFLAAKLIGRHLEDIAIQISTPWHFACKGNMDVCAEGRCVLQVECPISGIGAGPYQRQIVILPQEVLDLMVVFPPSSLIIDLKLTLQEHSVFLNRLLELVLPGMHPLSVIRVGIRFSPDVDTLIDPHRRNWKIERPNKKSGPTARNLLTDLLAEGALTNSVASQQPIPKMKGSLFTTSAPYQCGSLLYDILGQKEGWCRSPIVGSHMNVWDERIRQASAPQAAFPADRGRLVLHPAGASAISRLTGHQGMLIDLSLTLSPRLLADRCL
ncbi:hypothetical protein NMY22_g1352 [Coprinellus aureogranulatus]|nr:hypothetical protein NMY22_g1352 [Coprinellus aureogranulatus]